MKSTLIKWASYLWDVQIDYRSSEYNPDLIVYMSQGRYQLCTDRAIYSHEDKYHNFTKILRQEVAYDRFSGNKVLVLGLGLGSIPILLDQIKLGHWDITAVEIDEEVVELALLYGYPKIDSQINSITADAAVYVDLCLEKFDLICVDVFVGEHTPQKFRTPQFLESIQSISKPDGLVIYNTLAFTEEDRKQSKAYYEDVFLPAYPQSRCINAHKNYMLLSY